MNSETHRRCFSRTGISGYLGSVLAVGAILFGLLAGYAGAAGTGSISGTVTGGATGGTVLTPGPCVAAYDSDGDQVDYQVTDRDGHYKIDGLSPGEYRLEFIDCSLRLGPPPDPYIVCVGARAVYCLLPGLPSKFYDNMATLAAATPVTVVDGEETAGIDGDLGTGTVTDDSDNTPGTDDGKAIPSDPPDPPDPTVYKAVLDKVTVKGPARVRKGKVATFKVKIRNSGNTAATGVKLKVHGRGVRVKVVIGKIPVGSVRTVKAKVKPKKSGKAKFAFSVTSTNAGHEIVRYR